MKPLAFTNLLFVAVGVIAIGMFLSPQLRAQGVGLGGTTNGAEPMTVFPTATNVYDTAGGLNATATGGGTVNTGATALGASAFAVTSSSTAVGSNSGPAASANAGYTAIGANADFNGPGIFSVGIGGSATNASSVLSSGAYSVAIGGGNGVGGNTGAVASGLDSVAIGVSSVASGANSIAMSADGPFPARASGAFSTVIGDNSSATNTEGLSLGTNLTNTGAFATNVGNNNSVTGTNSVAMGTSNSVTGNNAGAFGVFSTASGASSYAIGNGAAATATNALALGSGASAGFTNSTAIGTGATTTRANQMSFGTATNTYTMAGVTSAASTAAQSGPTQFVTTDLAGNLAAFNLAPVFTSISNSLSVLNRRIGNVRNEEQGGIALAIATGNLRYDDRPGKISVAGGLGGFQHEAGGSLGLGYTAPNERVRFNVSAGGSTHGDFGGGGGLSFTLN